MKRSISVGLLVVAAYLAGYVTSRHATVVAQGRGEQAQQAPPAPQAVDGRAVVYTKEQIEKMYPPSDAKGDLPPSNVSTHLVWDPMYRFTEMRRVYYDPPRKDDVSGEMIRYPTGEMHENKTQIYVVWRGTATMVLGGKPEKERPGPYLEPVNKLLCLSRFMRVRPSLVCEIRVNRAVGRTTR